MSSSSMAPLVSVLVASYNYEAFIGRTIGSILNQTLHDLELIVVDDRSSDGSLDVIRSFQDPRVQLHVNDANMGLAWTYNKAASLARGRFVTYVDSDDWIEPGKFAAQVAFFDAHPKVDIVGTYFHLANEQGERHRLADQWEALFNQPRDFNAPMTWVGENMLVACTVMFRRDLHDRVGFRDQSMAIGTDFEYWTRAYAQGSAFGMVEQPLAVYRLHEDSVSRSDQGATFLEMCYIHHRNVLPGLERRGAGELAAAVMAWLTKHEQFRRLTRDQQHRLVGLTMGPPHGLDCAAFKQEAWHGTDTGLAALGRRFVEVFGRNPQVRAHRREVRELNERLQATDADRTARLEQVETLTALLNASEADRAARLEQIETLSAMLTASEADRAARLEQVETLGALLEASEADRTARFEQVEILAAELRASDADRVARLQQAETLTTLLQVSEADRAARLTQLELVAAELRASDADRVARLQQVETLTALLQVAEADRAARLEELKRFGAMSRTSGADPADPIAQTLTSQAPEAVRR